MNGSATSGRREIRLSTVSARTAPEASNVGTSIRRLGFWSAITMAMTYLIFLLGSSYALGSFLSVPWDQVAPIGASILIAPTFVLLTVSLHSATDETKRIWSLAAIAFAILYAAFVSIVYVTLLFVVEPQVVHHTESAVAPFLFGLATFLQMVDGLGYTYMSLASASRRPSSPADG